MNRYQPLLKQITLLVIGCSLSLSVFSQFGREIYREDHDEKPYYFGLSLGYANTYLAHSKSTNFLNTDTIMQILPGFSPAFSLGLMATLHPFRHFEFRLNPQLILGASRSFRYYLDSPMANMGENKIEKRYVQSTIISMPLSVKFNSDRIQNFRVYMLGGAHFDMDLASNANSRNADAILKLKKFDYGIHAGIGFNFYLPFVTVSPEIKFVYGLSDLHSRNPALKYSNTLDRLSSRMIMFTLYLEE